MTSEEREEEREADPVGAAELAAPSPTCTSVSTTAGGCPGYCGCPAGCATGSTGYTSLQPHAATTSHDKPV